MSPSVFTSKATRCTHAGDVVMRFCAPQGGCLLHLCAVRWRMGLVFIHQQSLRAIFTLSYSSLSAVPLLTSLLFVSLAMCTTFSIFSPVYFFFFFLRRHLFFFLHTTLLPLLHISLNPIFLQFACFKFLCIYRLSLLPPFDDLFFFLGFTLAHAHTLTLTVCSAYN